VQETGVVNFDVRDGTTRVDSHPGLQEGFAEVKLKDLSNQYDFISLRVGIQSFTSDFRGLIFSDQEPGARLFGNFDSTRYQFNLACFAMLEKDTNSGLNSMAYRHQQVMIANIYRQDFIKPGYTIQASFHYDKDDPSFQYNTDDFLVRPAPTGNVQPHAIRSYYYGLTGDGHFGKLNLTHAFYQVLGHDRFNELADTAWISMRRWPPWNCHSIRIGCATGSRSSTRPANSIPPLEARAASAPSSTIRTSRAASSAFGIARASR